MSTAMSQRTAATYQSVIIALVAAGLIGIGTMTLIYKRRRRRDFLRAVQSGRVIRQPGALGNRWVQLADGELVELRRNEEWGLTEGEIGHQPEIWDSMVKSEKTMSRDDDEKSESTEKEDIPPDDWSPMSLISSTSTPSTCIRPSRFSVAPNRVELSVLITMPSQLFDPQLPPYSLDEEEQLPAVSIASTSLPVSIPSGKHNSWEEIQKHVQNRSVVPVQALEGGGVRRVRADGFRS